MVRKLKATLIKKKDESPENFKGIKLVPVGFDGKLQWRSPDCLIIWRDDVEILLKYGRPAQVYESQVYESQDDAETS